MDYQRCLVALNAAPGPQPVFARLCADNLVEALHMHVGPPGGGAPRRMLVTQIDRVALARLAGVEDKAAVLQQQQQQQLAQQQQAARAAAMAAQQQQQVAGGPMLQPPGMGGPGMPSMPPLIPGAGGMAPPNCLGNMPPPLAMPSITGRPMPGVAPGMLGGAAAQGLQGAPPLDIDALLSRKTARDRMALDGGGGGGGELEAVLARPTAREAAQLEAFRTAAGQSAIQEHCPHLTKEECRRVNNSALACGRVHFRRLIFPHTDISLGNCSYLNTCRNFRNCKYVHYELDDAEQAGAHHLAGLPAHLAAAHQQLGLLPPGKPGVPKYLQALPQPQWIRCDIRTLDMKVLGKFGVIMADPPWQIHQDLPYGTMEDNEMRRMDIGCLQDDGVIFLWVTGRAMELGRECLKIWGYDRVDELIWVKTNQLNRLIRTGRTGHWINHSKEHCLVGVKGKPVLNRYVDCDVLVAEVRETSRKPDEMYALLERLSPGTRKLEIFARSHNLTKGWVGLGNQLDGVNILDPDMRARFIARYGAEGPDGKLPVPI